MGLNLWFEDVIDAYLQACAEGRDWQADCTAAQERTHGQPLRVLTQKALKTKGIPYSRQYIAKLVRKGTFPKPFQLASTG